MPGTLEDPWLDSKMEVSRGVPHGSTWYHNSRMILDELWTNHEKPIKMIYNDLKWIILRQFRDTHGYRHLRKPP